MNEDEEIDFELFEHCQHWAHIARHALIHWEMDDVINEAWVYMKSILNQYDENLGSLETFVKVRAWSGVWRAYLKSQPILERRLKVNNLRRTRARMERCFDPKELNNRFTFTKDMQCFIEEIDPLVFHPDDRLIAMQLARGIRPAQIERNMNRTSGFLAYRLKRMKKHLIKSGHLPHTGAHIQNE